MRDPQLDLAVNCVSTMNLVEACRKHNPAARLLYTSTRQVYGRPQRLPVAEDHPTVPIDVNGINKLAAEYYHLLYDRTYGIRSTVLRLTNTFGPRQQIRSNRQGFATVFLRQAPARRNDQPVRRRRATARLQLRRRRGERHDAGGHQRRLPGRGVQPGLEPGLFAGRVRRRAQAALHVQGRVGPLSRRQPRLSTSATTMATFRSFAPPRAGIPRSTWTRASSGPSPSIASTRTSIGNEHDGHRHRACSTTSRSYAAIEQEVLAAVREVFASGIARPRPAGGAVRGAISPAICGGGIGGGRWQRNRCPGHRTAGAGRSDAGDEVITVANTAIPTVSAIRMAGALPVFCDVDPRHAADGPRRCRTAHHAAHPGDRAGAPVRQRGRHAGGDGNRRAAWPGRRRRLRQSCGTTIGGQAYGHVWRRRLLFVLSHQEPGRLWRRGVVLHAPPGAGRGDAADSRLRLRQDVRLPARGDQQPAGRTAGGHAAGQAAATCPTTWRGAAPSRRPMPSASRREHRSRRRRRRACATAITCSWSSRRARAQIIERLRPKTSASASTTRCPSTACGPIGSWDGQQARCRSPRKRPAEVLSLPCYPELALHDVRRICRIINDAHESHELSCTASPCSRWWGR